MSSTTEQRELLKVAIEQKRKNESEILSFRNHLTRQMLTGIGLAVSFWGAILAGTIFTQDPNFEVQNSAVLMFLSAGAIGVCAIVGIIWYLRFLNNAFGLSQNRVEQSNLSAQLGAFNEGSEFLYTEDIHTVDASLDRVTQTGIPSRTRFGLTALLLISCCALGLAGAFALRWVYLVRHEIHDVFILLVSNWYLGFLVAIWIAGTVFALFFNKKRLDKVDAHLKQKLDTSQLKDGT